MPTLVNPLLPPEILIVSDVIGAALSELPGFPL
jgi:hypothetical protein